MKTLITLSILCIAVAVNGQERVKTNKTTTPILTTTVKGSVALLMDTNLVYKPPYFNLKPLNSFTFKGNSDTATLVIMNNGDIFYKGRKLTTDTAIVNGFRRFLNIKM